MTRWTYAIPRAHGEDDTPIIPDAVLIEAAAQESTDFLMHLFSMPEIHIKPLSRTVMHDWRAQWSSAGPVYDLPRSYKNGLDRAAFGFALYHGETLCGFSMNALVHTHRTKPHAHDLVDAQMEYINKGPLSTPLRGYVFACLCETLVTYAHLQEAERAVISTILSPRVRQQFLHLGFIEDDYPVSRNDAYLDIDMGARVDWDRFLKFRQEQFRPCPSPPSLSI